MKKRIDVLDHGYVELVESWGSDRQIVESARMSTGSGFRGWGPGPCRRCGVRPDAPEASEYCAEQDHQSPHRWALGDERLLSYLYRNRHTSPFEMAGLTVEVRVPLFVARQWHRHRTQSYNEASARYTALEALDYVPTVERLTAGPSANKQATGSCGDTALASEFVSRLQRVQSDAEELYTWAQSVGIPNELARLSMTTARYTKFRASANLWNWIRFLGLRMDQHAQHEIQVFASAVGTIIGELFPRTWALVADELGCK